MTPRLPASGLADLTERQREVLALIARGRTNFEIAQSLGISLEGAKYHVREIMARLEVQSREDAAAAFNRERSLGMRVRRTAAGIFSWRVSAPLGAAALAVAAFAAFAVVSAVQGSVPELAIIGTKQEDPPIVAQRTATPVPATACPPVLTLAGASYRAVNGANTSPYLDLGELGPQIGVTTSSEGDPCVRGEGNAVGLAPGRAIHELPGVSSDVAVAVSFDTYAVVFLSQFGPGKLSGLVERVTVHLPEATGYDISDPEAVARLSAMVDAAEPAAPREPVGPTIHLQFQLHVGPARFDSYFTYSPNLDHLGSAPMPPEFEELLRAHAPGGTEWPE